MEGQYGEVSDLQEGRDVKTMDAEKGGRRARDEDACLIDGIVGGIERTPVLKRRLVEGEEEGRCNALVDRIFGNIHQEKGQHTVSTLGCWAARPNSASEDLQGNE